MNRAMSAVRTGAEWISALLFGAIVVTFGANIVARYVFSRPIIWADELVVVLLIWVTFLTAALVTQEREQVIFDLLYERLGPSGRRTMLIAGSLILCAILVAALPAMISYTAFLWRERTNVLEWRLDRVYGCFAFFLVVLVIRRLALIVGLLRADWRATLASVEGRDAPVEERA